MMDMPAVVDKLAAFGLLRTDRVRGSWYTIYCPFHNNGQERKPSCGVSLTDEYRGGKHYPAGTFHCFSCGAVFSLTEAVTELLKLHNVTQDSRTWITENIPDLDADSIDFEKLIPSDLSSAIESKFAVAELQRISALKPVTYVPESELQSYRYTVPYMYERKLTDEIIEKFDVGVDLNFIPEGRKRPVPSITFPVRDKFGNVLFIARRSIEGKFFNLPDKVVKPVYGLYELPPECKSVIVCESAFNALTCWVYGRPAVALFGTGNPYQIRQLKELGVSEFILALDPDAAGHKGTVRLKNALSSIAIVWCFEGIPEGKDINDLSKAEFDQLTLA